MSLLLIALAAIGVIAITAALFAAWVLLCQQVGRFLVHKAFGEVGDE